MLDFGLRMPPGAQTSLHDVNSGFIAGTRVATAMGWRPVEAVAAGDRVLTFDGGLQEVLAVTRQTVWTGGARAEADLWPLHVPAGTLGNREAMTILSGQPVMIESDMAERLFGDPFATIPARSLEGLRGIACVPPADRIEVVHLRFAQDEIVFANVGALFHCPAQTDLLQPRVETYPVLPLEQADALVECLAAEDDSRGQAPQVRAAA